MSNDHEFTMTLKDASIYLRLPQETVLKCVRYVPRPNGGIRLAVRDKKGDPFFREVDLKAFLSDLSKEWVDNHAEKRPEIPVYFQEALKLETGLKCGLCGSGFAKDFSHIIPWDECHHHHPWNLLALCTKCHPGYDREKRIQREEVQRAKSRVQDFFLNELKYTISGEKCLSWLQRINVAVNGTFLSGIDLLISTRISDDRTRIQISKVRGVTLLSYLGDGNTNNMPELIKLTELLASHLSQGRFTDPFWEKFSDIIYDDSCPLFPDIPIKLAPDGIEMMEHLMKHAVDFIDPHKYTKFAKLKPVELIKKLTTLCCNQQDWLDGKDRMPDLSLNNSSV